MTHIAAVVTQLAFRGRNDDGNETTATWIDATNTNWSQRRDETFRVRIAAGETAGGDPKGPTHSLEYQINGGGWNTATTTTPVQLTASATVADGAATTEQISSGLTSGAFAAGSFDSDGTVAGSTYVENGRTENEFCLTIDSTQTAANDVIELRVTGCEAYDFTPSITAIDVLLPDAPTLVSPADNAELAGAASHTFSWTFNGNEPGDTQSHFAFQRVKGTDWSVVSDTPTLAGNGRGCAFSPDGSLLAVTYLSSPFLTVLNTSDWSTVSGTPTLPNYGRDCAFSPDGSLLAIGHSDSPYLTVLNTSDWSTVSGTPTLAGVGYGCASSPDGSLLAIAHGVSPRLTVLNTSDWSTVSGTPTLPNSGIGCAFSPDGSLLAIAHLDSPYFTVLNTSDWSVVSDTPTLAGNGYGCAFSPDGSLLIAAHANYPYFRVFNTSDWAAVMVGFTLPSTGYGCAFSPGGSLLAVTHDNNPNLTVVNTSDWSVVSDTPTLAGTGRGCAFSPDGSPLAATYLNSPRLTVVDYPSKQWWNGTAWVSSETFIASTDEEVTFPAGAWQD